MLEVKKKDFKQCLISLNNEQLRKYYNLRFGNKDDERELALLGDFNLQDDTGKEELLEQIKDIIKVNKK